MFSSVVFCQGPVSFHEPLSFLSNSGKAAAASVPSWVVPALGCIWNGLQRFDFEARVLMLSVFFIDSTNAYLVSKKSLFCIKDLS